MALERILDEEQPFGLVVHGPQALAALHWCEAAVHVLDPRSYERTSTCELPTAQLIWGCEALSARATDEASALEAT